MMRYNFSINFFQVIVHISYWNSYFSEETLVPFVITSILYKLLISEAGIENVFFDVIEYSLDKLNQQIIYKIF